MGGLLVSQVLTLFTTPVIYLAFRPSRAPLPSRGTGAVAADQVKASIMNRSRPFIERPVATTLLTLGVAIGCAVIPADAGGTVAAGGFPVITVTPAGARRQPGDDGGDRGDAA